MVLTSVDSERLRQAFLQCRDMEGTLREQLEAYAAAGREIFPAYGEAVDRLVERLHANGGGENAPRPGDPMPPFVLPDDQGRLVTLDSLIARGPVAVMFFRGHWCPYRRLKTLLQQRMHALPELGELHRALASKQVAAEFGLELLDRARQRGLRHVAVVGRLGEIQRARHRKEISHLVHFHDRLPRSLMARNVTGKPLN